VAVLLGIIEANRTPWEGREWKGFVQCGDHSFICLVNIPLCPSPTVGRGISSFSGLETESSASRVPSPVQRKKPRPRPIASENHDRNRKHREECR